MITNLSNHLIQNKYVDYIENGMKECEIKLYNQ